MATPTADQYSVASGAKLYAGRFSGDANLTGVASGSASAAARFQGVDVATVALYGPDTGLVNAFSEKFRVRGVDLPGETIITPYCDDPLAIFSPSSITLVPTAGAIGAVGSFKIKSATRGNIRVRVKSNISVIEPEPIYIYMKGGEGPVTPAITHIATRGDGVGHIYCSHWKNNPSYERRMHTLVWEGTGAAERIDWYKNQVFLESLYQLMIDDSPFGSPVAPLNSTTLRFDVNATTLSSGWHKVHVSGLGAGEFVTPYFVFVHRAGMTMPTLMPTMTPSYTLNHHHAANGDALRFAYAWVPAKKANPRYRPLSRGRSPDNSSGVGTGPFPYFSDTKNPNTSPFVRENLVPPRQGDVTRPCVDANGIYSVGFNQPYFWSNFLAKYPVLPLLDGPRGVATCSMVAHIEVGISSPNASQGATAIGDVNNFYFCDPWRVCKVRNNGTVVTLAGYRHKEAPYLSNTAQDSSPWGKTTPDPQLELVGDWSEIPMARRGFHELWGIAWNDVTFQIDESTAPIPDEQYLKQHFTGVELFVPDSQNNRVCKIKFSYVAHNVPPKVSEFLTGLADPWDNVRWHSNIDGRTKLLVSEREADRIAQYDMETGALERIVLERRSDLPRYVSLEPTNRWALHQPGNTQPYAATALQLSNARQHPCLMPEGLYVMDDWLYWGSYALRQVRRVHLITGETEVIVENAVAGNASAYIKIAVSDGTFMPRHTVFYTTWQNDSVAAMCVLPDKTPYAHVIDNAGGNAGRSPGWFLYGYATAVGVGRGKLVVGKSDEGITRISLNTNPIEPVVDIAKYKVGYDKYMEAGYYLLHGEHGYGHYDYDPPFGVDPDIDYYLSNNYFGAETPNYRIPLAGEVVQIGTNTSADVVPTSEGWTSANWDYSLFGSYGGGAFADTYSAFGAYVLAGTGGHGHPDNHGAAVFDFSTAAWVRLDNSNGVSRKPDPGTYAIAETTGAPYYEITGSAVPSPGHTYCDVTVLPGGSRGKFVSITRSSVCTESVFTSQSHQFDLETKTWSRFPLAGFSPKASVECDSVYDAARNVIWRTWDNQHDYNFVEYVDLADMTVKRTATFSWPSSAINGYFRVWLHDGLLMRHCGTNALWYFDPDNASAGWGACTVSGALPANTQNRWARYNDLDYYSFAGDSASAVINKITPPVNAKTGTWVGSTVTLDASLPARTQMVRHYTRLFFVPGICCMAWIAGGTNKVSIFRPPV